MAQEAVQPLGDLVAGAVRLTQHLAPELYAQPPLTRWAETARVLQGRADNRQLSCAVLTCAKTGKSTLLNALVGRTLLPSINRPETACILRLTHTADTEPCLKHSVPGRFEGVYTGDQAVREQLWKLNEEGRARRADESADLQLYTPMAALQELSRGEPAFATGGAAGVQLTLLDTPGPNEAGQDHLRHQVERLLSDSVDAVIFLLDYTKLKTEDEAQLLDRLKALNPGLLADLSTRLIFVVNKFDQASQAKGMGPVETQKYVADFLNEQLDIEGFRLHPHQVHLVSAQDAQLARVLLAGKADSSECERFQILAFGRASKGMPPADKVHDAALDILGNSGIVDLETAVLHFLYDKRASLHDHAITMDAHRLLQEVEMAAIALQRGLQRGTEQLQQDLVVLRAKADEIVQNFTIVKGMADDARRHIIEQVRERMTGLTARLTGEVMLSLGTLETASSQGSWRRPWPVVRRLVSNLLQRSSASRDRYNESLEELQASIHAQLGQEIEDFIHETETACNAEQKRLLAAMSAQLDRLAGAFQDRVGEVLQVRLEPARLQLTAPSATQFHSDLQRLFAEGIRTNVTTTTERRTEMQMRVERVRRPGLCGWREVTQQRPHPVSVNVQRTQTSYTLALDNIETDSTHVQAFFIAAVRRNVEASEEPMHSAVSEVLARRTAEARALIDENIAVYMRAVETAEAISSQGIEAETASLKAVGHDLADIRRLKDQAHERLRVQDFQLDATPPQMAGLDSAPLTSPAASSPPEDATASSPASIPENAQDENGYVLCT